MNQMTNDFRLLESQMDSIYLKRVSYKEEWQASQQQLLSLIEA